VAGFDPELVHKALFDRLKTVAGLGSCRQRRLVDFDQVPADRQPALIVTANGGRQVTESDYPALTWMLEAVVYLYVREPNDKSATAETTIFDLMKKIKAQLLPQVGESQPNTGQGTTLGGLVQSCMITSYVVDLYGEGQTVTALRIQIETAE